MAGGRIWGDGIRGLELGQKSILQ